MHIGVIASMKKGLEHFVHRELQLFAARGAKISLFHTKYGPGLYGSEPGWTLYHWSAPVVVLMQPVFFLRRPGKYLALLREALAARAVVDFMLAWYFAKAMAEVDVIYATFGDRKLFIAYFCKRILDKPLAVTIHAYELYNNPNPGLFLTALAACDQIITVTDYNKQLLAERYRIDPARIEVVRITVNLDDYVLEPKFVILIVAFFAERKGHEVLFRALKQLQQPDLEVWVVGDMGPEDLVVDARALAEELGVAEQVAFFGKLSGAALKAVYRECDVFCLPCHHDRLGVAEGFPTVLAEAMAFSKPVITTRHVEIPRIVEQVLVDEQDVDGLAEAIRQVYAMSLEQRRQLGERNRQLAGQFFPPDNATRTVRILSDLAGRR